MRFKERGKKEKRILKKGYKGMTLIEVVVVMVILGILTVPIFGIVIENQKLTNHLEEHSNAKDIGVIVQQHLYNRIKMADAVTYSSIVPASMPIETYCIFVDSDGLNLRTSTGDRILISQKEINPYNLNLEFEKSDSKTTEMIINLNKLERGISKSVYSQKVKVKSINMTSNSITTPTTGSAIIYHRPY